MQRQTESLEAQIQEGIKEQLERIANSLEKIAGHMDEVITYRGEGCYTVNVAEAHGRF